MGIMSWKLEFYPPISKVKKNPIDSIEHSLNKWIGLRKENLEKHGLKYSIQEYHEITDDNKDKVVFAVDANSCSLCRNYENCCESCPINRENQFDCLDEFGEYRELGNPEPMIKLLQDTLDFYKEQNNNRK